MGIYSSLVDTASSVSSAAVEWGLSTWPRDQRHDDREVAIKTPPAILSANPKAVRQLKDEASRGMALSHPNIVGLRHIEGTNGIQVKAADRAGNSSAVTR